MLHFILVFRLADYTSLLLHDDTFQLVSMHKTTCWRKKSKILLDFNNFRAPYSIFPGFSLKLLISELEYSELVFDCGLSNTKSSCYLYRPFKVRQFENVIQIVGTENFTNVNNHF